MLSGNILAKHRVREYLPNYIVFFPTCISQCAKLVGRLEFEPWAIGVVWIRFGAIENLGVSKNMRRAKAHGLIRFGFLL